MSILINGMGLPETQQLIGIFRDGEEIKLYGIPPIPEDVKIIEVTSEMDERENLKIPFDMVDMLVKSILRTVEAGALEPEDIIEIYGILRSANARALEKHKNTPDK